MSKPPFPRSVCDCDECAAHCRRGSGFLAPGDAERIERYTRRPVQTFPAPAAIVGGTLDGTLFTLNVPGVMLSKRLVGDRAGQCVYFTSDGRCAIHAVSPFGCAYYDAHISREESDQRTRWWIEQQLGVPIREYVLEAHEAAEEFERKR